MHAMILNDPEFHVLAPEIFKAVRRGQFPQAFAQLYADVGFNAGECEALGTAVESLMRMKDGHSKGKKLGLLAVRLSKKSEFNDTARDHPGQQEMVNDLFGWAIQHNGSRYWEPPPLTVLVGYVVGAATLAEAMDQPLDPHRLADLAHLAVVADQLPFSITDMRDTLYAIIRHRPITDWILEEEVQELRRRFAERKAKSNATRSSPKNHSNDGGN